jgi:hypothetical protein
VGKAFDFDDPEHVARDKRGPARYVPGDSMMHRGA